VIAPRCESTRSTDDASELAAAVDAAFDALRDFPAATESSDACRSLPPSPGARARRWIRQRLGRSDYAWRLPRLREPVRNRIPRLRRSAFWAWWSARDATAGVDEFLRDRRLCYLAQLPLAPERLPAAISVDGGRVVVSPRTTAPPPPDWLATYLRVNGTPALEHEIRRTERELAAAEAALRSRQQRLAAARRDLEEAARAPALASSDVLGEGGCGRPAVPPPWSAAIAACMAGLVCCEGWLLAVPLLRGAGVALGDLAAEASSRPGVMALPLVLALGASVCLFVFAELAVVRARSVVGVLPARWRAAAHAAGGVGLLAIAVALAWAILVRRASEPSPAAMTSFLIALALPLAASPFLAAARRLHAVRAEAIRVARRWDDAHQHAITRWARQRSVVEAADRDCAAVESARGAWAERLHALQQRDREVETLAAAAAETEALELRRVCREIAMALELDRHAFVRNAGRRSAVSSAPNQDGGECDRSAAPVR
jgi:hypothetical protein